MDAVKSSNDACANWKKQILLNFVYVHIGDEKGHLFSWNHQQNEVYEHVPLAGQINCISCPPDEEGVVVVG